MHRKKKKYCGHNVATSTVVPLPLRERLGEGAFVRINKALLTILCMATLLFTTHAHASVTVETTSLGHGVKAWYATNESVPVVDVILSFEGAGNASDAEGKAGRAAFAASLLTEGAGDLDSSAFRRALDERAIQMEVSTDNDRLKIHIYCLREHAVRAGELLAFALSKPQLTDADQARMKADMGSLIARLEERPNYRADRLLTSRMFQGHPYANAPYGTKESLAALSAQDVRDFLGTYITRGNVLITAAGDVDASLLDDMLSPVVDALADNDSGAVAVTPTSMQGAGETLRASMNVPQTVILFASPAYAREDARFYASYLLNHILGGSALFSRLGEEIRQQKGLVYSVDTDLDVKRGASLLTGALATRNASVDVALTEVKNVLAAMHSNGVTTEECADAQSYVRGAFARRLDSSSAVSEMLLAMRIHKLGVDYIEKRDGLFKNVACSDINAAASDLLDPARFVFAVVGGAPDSGGSGPIPQAPTGHNDVK